MPNKKHQPIDNKFSIHLAKHTQLDESKPISDDDIYGFIPWAGNSKLEKNEGPDKAIAAVTIKKYLDGIRAWHIVRHTTRPTADKEVISLLLNIFKESYGKSDELELAGAVAIVAFWGMARLGELLRASRADGA